MSLEQARTWTIAASLALTCALMFFFFVAPSLGYPLEPPQALQLLEIILPLFLGYLGTASHFIFRPRFKDVQLTGRREQLGLLVRGPIYAFGVAMSGLLFAFGWSNRLAAPAGVGMSFETLSGSLAAALGLLAATTSVIVAYLFSASDPRGTAAADG